MEEMRNAYKILAGKPEGRDHSEDLGTDGRIIFRVDLGEIVWEDVDWIHLAQETNQWRAVVNTVLELWVP
jgi:hypothetical protein